MRHIRSAEENKGESSIQSRRLDSFTAERPKKRGAGGGRQKLRQEGFSRVVDELTLTP